MIYLLFKELRGREGGMFIAGGGGGGGRLFPILAEWVGAY